MKEAKSMNRMAGFLLVLMLATCSFAKDNKDNKDNKEVLNLRGSIMDSQCAFNVHSDTHSHDWMTKRGVQGATDENSCTKHCVKDMGGSYVLVVKKEVYKLDDQIQPEQFSGKKVKVNATLDAKTHSLHVFSMEEDKDK